METHGDTPAPLAGRVALVTGGAQRVGAAIVRRLHAAGARVVVHHHRSARQAERLVAELDAERAGSAIGVRADLLEVARLGELIEATTAAFGRLDILVNNASTFYATPVGEITEAHWDDLLGSNLKAPLFLSQAARTALQLSNGLILNIVDIHGLRPLRRYPVYSVAKAGLIMLTHSLARELGPQIRVNAIAPGPVMWPADGATDPALQRKIVERTLLKRSGSAEDIARTALFFAADAPYVTGQVLAVDGGRSVGW
ncbi:MAG: pteridine reductase [Steroidobacteraceae bacterium]|nr:pteridine reductase [Nevskiaceae bacterium]MCP5471127.1 pteridine reductase [Nevskiaceae bacterium]